MHGLAVALFFAADLARLGRVPAEVERLTSELIELSTRQNFGHWLVVAFSLRGWARTALGNTTEGIFWIEDGMGDYQSIRGVPYFLALKAEALYLANRTPGVLAAIKKAEALVDKYREGSRRAELYRLRGVFFAAMDADDTQIEVSFCAAIKTANEQKSVSLAKRAEATYAKYRRQKASGSGGRGFGLPLWQLIHRLVAYFDLPCPASPFFPFRRTALFDKSEE